MTSYAAYDQGLPCRNKQCHSYGEPHPNCRCYSGGNENYASGGSVCALNLPHDPGCALYAGGGPVQSQMVQQQPDNIPNAIGMAGVSQGLLSLLTQTGHAKLADPDSHIQKIHDLQNTPDDMATTIHEHPLAAGASKKNLIPIMQRLGNPILNGHPHPEGLRSSIDYLNSSIKGEGELDHHMGKLLGTPKASDRIEENEGAREKLKTHLEDLKEHPEKMLNIGGSLGHYLPDHSASLAYHSAQATQYLDGLKPQTQQLAPLDTAESVDKMAQASYDRQLDIAEKPLLALQHLKDGTLIPQDLTTVQTIYPGLYQSMVKKATEALVNAKTKETEIPYKQKMTLSMLLGQPLDFTQSSMAAQAIIASAIPQQQAQAQKPMKSSHSKSGATAATLKQIDKVDELYQTPLEARQINRNSK